jgi:hypothetical protein
VSRLGTPCALYTKMPGDAGDIPRQLLKRFPEALVGVRWTRQPFTHNLVVSPHTYRLLFCVERFFHVIEDPDGLVGIQSGSRVETQSAQDLRVLGVPYLPLCFSESKPE